MKTKAFLMCFVGSIVTLVLGSPVLQAQSVDIITAEIPEPSGGSQAGSSMSSENAILGPDSLFGPSLQSVPVNLESTLNNTFEGFGFDDNATENRGSFFIPPDPIGAAGPDRLIAVVNTMIEARTKAGGLLWRDSLADFFKPLRPLTFTFDPKVIYDQYEDRFLVVTLEKVEIGSNPDRDNVSRILLAVSKSSIPASATKKDWEYHAIDSKTTISDLDHWADYPGFEVDEEAVYITANMFRHIIGDNPLSRVFGGVRLWIVDKGVARGFYRGGRARVTVHDPYFDDPLDPDDGGIVVTTMPAQVFGADGVGGGGGVESEIGTFLVSYSGLTNGTDEFVQIVRVDDPLGAVSFTQEFVDVGHIDSNLLGGLPDAPQLGTDLRIEVNDRRALDAVWRGGYLWLTTTILPNSGPDLGETTAHWFRLDTLAVVDDTSDAGLIELYDQGDIGGEDIADSTTTFFPSVAVNAAGDAKFGFAASASTIFAGAFVTGRQSGDPEGTVQASLTVHAGEDYYVRTDGTRNRWGDYSGISLDPSDDAVFWVFNQFADNRGTVFIAEDGIAEDGRWGTAWASCTVEIEEIEVAIGSKSGSNPTSINTRSRSVVPVTILGSDTFEVSDIDVTTLSFGPAEAIPAHDLTAPAVLADHQKDVNGDGFTDLVSHYRQRETGLAAGDTEACINGGPPGCAEFEGCDAVRIVN